MADSKPTVYVLDPYHPDAIAALQQSTDINVVLPTDPNKIQYAENSTAVMLRSETRLGADELAKCKRLKYIVKQGVGVDNIDLKAAAEAGIKVYNTPGLNGEAVAELTLALALTLSRRVAEIDRRTKNGEVIVRSQTLGKSLFKKTLGVIGMGNIGLAVAKKWVGAMEGSIVAYDPFSDGKQWLSTFGETRFRQVSKLHDLLRASDVVTLHLPLTKDTENIISTAEFGAMRDGAILLNCARGGIVNEDALLTALNSGKLFGAGLDAMMVEPPTIEAYPELLALPNVVLTPHVGASTVENQSQSGMAVAEITMALLRDHDEPLQPKAHQKQAKNRFNLRKHICHPKDTIMPKTRRQRRESPPRPKKTARLTCNNCRARKVRCDGGQPVCGICIAYNETCQYDRPPPMTQIRAMADKIAQLEQTIQDLQKQDVTSTAPCQTSATVLTESAIVPALIEPLPTIEVADGNMDPTRSFYDTTSAVHDPGDTPSQATTGQITVAHSPETRQPLPMETPELKFWEDQAVESAAVYLSIPEEVIRRLFATHWTWVHANFMFVPRALFLRDAAVGGKFFSPFLLSVLCLHSTRFRERHLTEQLLARAKLEFSHEIHKEGSIPLVQALLQFSAREIGRGSVSQAWLYGGMAFRVAVDIGLFSLSPKTSEDVVWLQLGRHLAWSCFFWDKTLSLYLGRTPSLPEPPKWDPALPEELETKLWPPYPIPDDEALQTYQPRPSHLLLCFAYTCRISLIINDILFSIYGSKRTKDVLDFVQTTRERLHAWRSSLPIALHVDYQGQTCPPTHFVAQQMLYHTTIILLHRPFLNNPACWKACQEASQAVEQLLQLLDNTFGFQRFTYIMAYCTYTAATVVVQDMKSGRPDTTQRFKMFMRALNAITVSCPGIQRSIDILTRGLGTVSVEQEPPAFPEQAPQIPAFPYTDFSYIFSEGVDETSHDTTASSNAFFNLDSFPQLWFNEFSDNVVDDVHVENPM
ncbi:pathway-specific regulatory [Fusarium tjaetaba]|uniref:Pathway-specific regulatory n=1 Tax=Fusarium tjaetaba TaxID=1567544 RepID=A0A8H5VYN9_9HYPO|nr:pathway-specific regulatory [Fusarium tjaetaba]KAF5642452.1 pathway-specific regulatory [Fusarium tjaetaba]